MTLLTKNVNYIIEEAYKVASLYAEDENLSNNRLTEGLNLLQEIVDSYATSPAKIAFYSDISFNLVAGKRDYTISKVSGADVNANRIIELKQVSLLDGNSLTSVDIKPKKYFYSMDRDLSFTGLPRDVFLQNKIVSSPQLGEVSTLSFFVLPNKAYQCNVSAKFILEPISLNQPISDIPESYYLFLKYALAKELTSQIPAGIWDNKKEQRYMELFNDAAYGSEIDLSLNTGKALSRNYVSDDAFMRGGFYG